MAENKQGIEELFKISVEDVFDQKITHIPNSSDEKLGDGQKSTKKQKNQLTELKDLDSIPTRTLARQYLAKMNQRKEKTPSTSNSPTDLSNLISPLNLETTHDRVFFKVFSQFLRDREIELPEHEQQLLFHYLCNDWGGEKISKKLQTIASQLVGLKALNQLLHDPLNLQSRLKNEPESRNSWIYYKKKLREYNPSVRKMKKIHNMRQ